MLRGKYQGDLNTYVTEGRTSFRLVAVVDEAEESTGANILPSSF